MQDCTDSLRWLTSTLMERNCHPHFAAAHAEACCHLCHAPLREFIANCPCPHWFVSAFASQARLNEVAAMYDASALLQFLALCIYSERVAAGGPASAHLIANEPDLILHLRLRNRQWTVHFAGQPDATTCKVVLRKIRSGKCETVELNLSDRDLRLVPMLRTLCEAATVPAGTSEADTSPAVANATHGSAPGTPMRRGRPPKLTPGFPTTLPLAALPAGASPGSSVTDPSLC